MATEGLHVSREGIRSHEREREDDTDGAADPVDSTVYASELMRSAVDERDQSRAAMTRHRRRSANRRATRIDSVGVV